MMNTDKRYKLAPGSQVREEDFGLLFYTMSGPRLFFLPSGKLLAPAFFESRSPLGRWAAENAAGAPPDPAGISRLAQALDQLQQKGVIHEF